MADKEFATLSNYSFGKMVTKMALTTAIWFIAYDAKKNGRDLIGETIVINEEPAAQNPLSDYYQANKYTFIKQSEFPHDKLGDLAASDTIRLVDGEDKPINQIHNYYYMGLTKDDRKAFLLETFTRQLDGPVLLSLDDAVIDQHKQKDDYPYFNPNQSDDYYTQHFAMAFVKPSLTSKKIGLHTADRVDYLFHEDKPWKLLAEKANSNSYAHMLLHKFKINDLMGKSHEELFRKPVKLHQSAMPKE